MTKMTISASLVAAMMAAFAISHASGDAYAATVAAPTAMRSADADAQLADRQHRLLRWIQRGRTEGWLSRQQAREKYHALRQLRLREHDLRRASGGELTPPDRDALERDLHTVAQELRWSQARAQEGRYRSH